MTQTLAQSGPAPFADPDITAKGETRASVAFDRLQTLWVMTG
ncbi:MAG TPA: radical SAM protein, partial [Oceanicaulis sp.]|nr:radical SAM protein [Oceanicaulis sp.]